jgi:hypothetical protein
MVRGGDFYNDPREIPPFSRSYPFRTCSFPILPAIPMWPDWRWHPAGSETTAVPAAPVKARAAVPIGWAAGPSPVQFDLLGRAITGQKAITMPGTIGLPLAVRAGSGRNCRQQQESRNRDGEPSIAHVAASIAGAARAGCGRSDWCEVTRVAHCLSCFRDGVLECRAHFPRSFIGASLRVVNP